MKRKLAVICVLALAVGSFAFGQEQPWSISTPTEDRLWHLAVHPYDEKKAFDEIAKLVLKGLTPAGVEILPGKEIYMTYARNGAVQSNTWALFQIEGLGAVNPQIQKIVNEGWAPVDFMIFETGMTVLAVKSPVRVIEWRIFSSDLSKPSEIENDMNAYKGLGFQAVGISALNGRLWVLALKTEIPLYGVCVLKGYKNDGTGIISGLQYESSQGFSPMGIAITPSIVYALFSR